MNDSLGRGEVRVGVLCGLTFLCRLALLPVRQVRPVEPNAKFGDLLVLRRGDVDELAVLVDVEIAAVGEDRAVLPVPVDAVPLAAAVNRVDEMPLVTAALHVWR